MRITWTDKLVKAAQKILSRHTRDNFNAALAEISVKAGSQVNVSSLGAAFSRNGLKSPLTYMKASKFELHPVVKLEAKEEESKYKRIIDQLTEELRRAKSRQAFIEEVKKYIEPPRIMPREKNSRIREMTAVVLASDWHVEEPIYPESVSFRNEYNLEIAARRIERFFQGIIWNIEHQRASKRIAIRDLTLWLGGDLMTGYIHEELIEENQLSPTETMLWLIPKLRDGIATLLNHLDLDHIEIPCSFGNHGRTTMKPRISTGYANSYEWLMYNILAGEFRNQKRVHFEITPSAHQYVNVYDWVLHFHHGDDVKYQGGVGGIGIPLLKAVPQWDLIKKADVHNIGHFHSMLDYGRAVVNGSLIGYGPYGQRIRASFEVPAQAMYYMDRDRGKCMMTSLWVDDDPHREIQDAIRNPAVQAVTSSK